VARQGGDEFVVVAHGLGDVATARTLADQLAQRLREPVEVDGARVVVGASVGVALAPHDGRDADTLLRIADRAMFAGKSLGGRGR
jgi:diguanylate cyclase (GGDEF)-like protein